MSNKKLVTYRKYNKSVKSDLMDICLSSSHVLISGTTGSGKSVLIDEILYTMLCNYTPLDDKLILIDPKMVSLRKYKNTPFCIKYADNNADIINALDYAINIMMSRYEEMQKQESVLYSGSRLYIVIDELADLMTTCKKEVMPLLQRILQLGRAARVVLICATQEPNRIVIPSVLTVNFNCRIGLHCNDAIESKQIIKRKGCEELPQFGECIVFNKDGKYYHSKVDLISDEDLKAVVDFWKSQNQTPRKKEKSKIDYHQLQVAILGLIGSALSSYVLIKFVLFVLSAY